MNNKRLSVAMSPHASSSVGTRSLMMDVLIAMVPALCIAVYFFGPRALIATAVSVIACEVFEWAYCAFMKKPIPVGDLSAAVTGVLVAFVCPVTLPYWTLVIGDFFAIIVVKQLFGGLGKNFMNPALGGRAFLMLCYPVAMTTWAKAGEWASLGMSVPQAELDVITGATPLSAEWMKAGVLPMEDGAFNMLVDMFVGNVGGCIGEVSALMLLAGGIYLILRGVIRPSIPVGYIATVAILTFLFPQGDNGRFVWMLSQLFTGGLMLGAFFMATDYVTSPCSQKGEWVFGIGCGLLTVFIRYFGGYPEGVSYAILIMNVCSWLIDQKCLPARYGVTAEMRAAAKAKAKEEKAAMKAAAKAAKEGESK